MYQLQPSKELHPLLAEATTGPGAQGAACSRLHCGPMGGTRCDNILSHGIVACCPCDQCVDALKATAV
jgi:hypothetical protein